MDEWIYTEDTAQKPLMIAIQRRAFNKWRKFENSLKLGRKVFLLDTFYARYRAQNHRKLICITQTVTIIAQTSWMI